MRNIRLLISYDGTPFFGWQKSEAGPSIEEAVQTVLEQILQEPVTLQAASRTDRGVHAEGQVVNFFTSKEPPSLLSLNRLLPPTLRVLELTEMPESFHPSLNVKGKKYCYSICSGPFQTPFHRHYSWHVPHALDLEAMRAAAGYFIGEHDFSAFCNVHENQNYTNKIRHIESIEIVEFQGRFEIAIRGNHFLYKMVRTIVGTLVDVGRGRLRATEIATIVASKERPQAGVTAPAHGLSLKEIYY